VVHQRDDVRIVYGCCVNHNYDALFGARGDDLSYLVTCQTNSDDESLRLAGKELGNEQVRRRRDLGFEASPQRQLLRNGEAGPDCGHVENDVF
jgi:hypothetical protein